MTFSKIFEMHNYRDEEHILQIQTARLRDGRLNGVSGYKNIALEISKMKLFYFLYLDSWWCSHKSTHDKNAEN